MADPRDRRSPAARKAAVATASVRTAEKRAEEATYRNSKGYKFFVSKGLSRVIGALCIIVGLFAVIDYWGPRTLSHEKIQGYPNAGNYKLIRTDKSYFAIAYNIRHGTLEMGHSPIEVYRSPLTKTPLSFAVPSVYPGQVFVPLDTRYGYISLQIICLAMGLVLLFYRKYDDTRIMMVVLGLISFFAAVIPMIAFEMTMKAIYETKTNPYW